MPAREQIVAETRRWIGTPYHKAAMLRGVGCDCGTLLYCVYRDLGIIAPDVDLGLFSHDWFHHASDERYFLKVMREVPKVIETICYRSTVALPGSIVLTKCVQSKRYNHGGIVTKWPKVIHAVAGGVEEIDASRHPMWEKQSLAIFDPFNNEDAA